jgi:hypothetical protein
MTSGIVVLQLICGGSVTVSLSLDLELHVDAPAQHLLHIVWVIFNLVVQIADGAAVLCN